MSDVSPDSRGFLIRPYFIPLPHFCYYDSSFEDVIKARKKGKKRKIAKRHSKYKKRGK
jgi:hypothetical protein